MEMGSSGDVKPSGISVTSDQTFAVLDAPEHGVATPGSAAEQFWGQPCATQDEKPTIQVTFLYWNLF